MAPLVPIGTCLTIFSEAGPDVKGLLSRWGEARRRPSGGAGTFQSRLADSVNGSRGGRLGAVFGTPLAGAVFAMEVLAIGRI